MITVEFTSRHIKMGRGFRAMTRRRLMSRLRRHQSRVGLVNLHLQKIATSEDEKRYAVTISVELRPLGMIEVMDYGIDPIAAYENTEVGLSQAVMSNVAYLRRHRSRDASSQQQMGSPAESGREFGFGKGRAGDQSTSRRSSRRIGGKASSETTK